MKIKPLTEQNPTRKHLLDIIYEWLDGEQGWNTLEEHTGEDAIRLKDEAQVIFMEVINYLKSQ